MAHFDSRVPLLQLPDGTKSSGTLGCHWRGRSSQHRRWRTHHTRKCSGRHSFKLHSDHPVSVARHPPRRPGSRCYAGARHTPEPRRDPDDPGARKLRALQRSVGRGNWRSPERHDRQCHGGQLPHGVAGRQEQAGGQQPELDRGAERNTEPGHDRARLVGPPEPVQQRRHRRRDRRCCRPLRTCFERRRWRSRARRACRSVRNTRSGRRSRYSRSTREHGKSRRRPAGPDQRGRQEQGST